MEYTLTKVVMMFFIYGFLGWCVEVAFAACKNGKFVNRGFLNGPICPIYGFGVVGVVWLLRPYLNNIWLLFLGSVILTTAIELLTGFLLEKIFKAKWWDYSKMPLNIGGYVCLLFSLIWGFACMLVVKFINPPIYALVTWMPNVLTWILIGLLGATFIIDLAATIATIRNLNKRLSKLTELAAEIHNISDGIGETISEKTLIAKQKMEEGQEKLEEKRELAEDVRTRKMALLRMKIDMILEERPFAHKRLLNAFPNLKSAANQEALNKLRESLKQITQKVKN